MIFIATRHMQQTSGDIPPQLTLFCSVVAAASDNSSYNIYIYGGYDGIDSVVVPLMMSMSSRFHHSLGLRYTLGRVLMVAADINV